MIFVSRTACTNNQCFYKDSSQLLPVGLDILLFERSLRLLLKNCKDDFQDLLRCSGDISIHQKCINWLTEVYKYICDLSPEIINKQSFLYQSEYHARQFNVFKTHLPTSNKYGLNLIPYEGYLVKPTNSGTYFLKTSNHLRH